MNILMLSPLFYPHIGGVEKHVKRTSEELISRGHEVSVITIKHASALPDFEQLDRLRVYRFPEKRLLKIWLWLYQHRHLVRRADVVHCHDFVTFILWYLPFRFIYFSKPVFVTFHGFEGIIPIPQRILLLRTMTARLTKGNICVGDYIQKWYEVKANLVLYGGVDRSSYELGPSDRSMSGEASAVFVGRLERDSGIMIYVEAVRVLKEKYGVNLELVVCGDGSLRKIVEETATRNGLTVKLLGFVEDPSAYLLRARFAFVSGYLSILEAMISKKLAFAPYENELKKDYLTLLPNSSKMIVTASSPDELAQKIMYYYENSQDAEEMIETAYDFAKEQTWEKVAGEYLELWGKSGG